MNLRVLLIHNGEQEESEMGAALARQGHIVECERDLRIGLQRAAAEPFDAVVLDARSRMIAVRLADPNLTTLFSRLQKLAGAVSRPGDSQLCFGDVQLDLESGVAVRTGQKALLTVREVELLRYLAQRAGEVVTRQELLTSVWRYHPQVTSRTIDVHMSSLRQKLEENPRRPRYLLTIRGVGYRFAA